ncbi:MAG: glycosyltransferase, partial [Minisyncoccia bacterium]
MRVLVISSDRKVFEKGSAVRSRLLDYGRLADELHVIVFAKKALGFQDEVIQPNIFLYSTNSLGKFFHIPHAILCALKLKRRGVAIDVVTTQDPFEAGLAGYIIARILKARLHIQIHTDVMSSYFAHESILNQARVILAKFLIPHANAIRVVSERIKNSLSTFNIQHSIITVLPILTETKNRPHAFDLKKKYPQFDFHILVASRLSREKNIGSAVESMRSVVSA